jgi:hypothetical protein
MLLSASMRYGKSLISKVAALEDLRSDTPYLLPPPGIEIQAL